jgi:hypothetical protein
VLTQEEAKSLRRRFYEDMSNAAVYTQSFRMEMALWLCCEFVCIAVRLCAPELQTPVQPMYDIHADGSTVVEMAKMEAELLWRVFTYPDRREEEFERLVRDRATELAEEDEVDWDDGDDEEESEEGGSEEDQDEDERGGGSRDTEGGGGDEGGAPHKRPRVVTVAAGLVLG